MIGLGVRLGRRHLDASFAQDDTIRRDENRKQKIEKRNSGKSRAPSTAKAGLQGKNMARLKYNSCNSEVHGYWRKAGADLPLQLVVIKPLGYRLRKGSKLLYRLPAFLICTDLELNLQTLVQSYLYRWEIAGNHRDKKSLLGIAQGQVRNPHAVRRLPQLQVAGYSLLLLASLLPQFGLSTHR